MYKTLSLAPPEEVFAELAAGLSSASTERVPSERAINVNSAAVIFMAIF